MAVFLVDTETTGLPKYGFPADAPCQPRMCSVSMALLSDEGDELKRYTALVRPESWPLDDREFMASFEHASKVAHGLTVERLHDEGVPIAEIYGHWPGFYGEADVVCGFNVWFDHKILRGEWKRLGHPVPFREKQGICLMKAARPLCGLSKSPKLSEAVRILLDREHGTAHTADGDVDVSIDLYRYLLSRDALTREDQPGAKGRGEA
jgi:DNA polymerase III epsilon subunit-like protein